MPLLLPSLFLLALAAPILAQSAQNQPQQTIPITTLHTSTSLVVVDVIVTDKNKNPVHNLKAEHFTLLENNAQQTIKGFEEHTAPAPAELQKIEPMPKMPAGVFTNFTPAPPNGPVNVLLLDRLNTPLEDQGRLRTQLLDYLKKVKPGTRIAIFGLATQLTLLKGFTDDPALLMAILESKPNLKASPLLDDPIGGGGTPESLSDMIKGWVPMLSSVAATNGGTGSTTISDQRLYDFIAYAQMFEVNMTAHQQEDRAKRTLEGMNALARYLVGIPGRKNLIWFSGSFPIHVLPNADLSSLFYTDPTTTNRFYPDFLTVTDWEAEYRETISLFSRAQVAVYPVDVRGVTIAILPGSSAANEGSEYLPSRPALDPTATYPITPPVPPIAQDINTFMEQTFEENNTMRDMAYETGGQAFLNTNDLTEAVANAIDNGANYYTLSYTPSDTNWNGDFRKIQIYLKQQDLNLSYRRGYYADDPVAPPSNLAKEARGRAVTAPMPPPSNFGAMHLALMHGGPEPAQIVFTVQVVPMSDYLEDTLVPGNEGSKGLKGPYRRFSLNIAADARGISFTRSADGMHHGAIEFVAFVYDASGRLINALGTPVNADFNSDLYLKVLQHGIPFHQEVSIPVKGDYFLRIAVHDLQGDHVGAVEVPIFLVQDLQPVEPLEQVSRPSRKQPPTGHSASAPAP